MLGYTIEMDVTRDIYRSSLLEFIEGLQATGRYTFTAVEARQILSSSRVAVDAALRRLKQAGRLVSPRRGFLVIVTPEYREAGSPPASWFIDELMSYLGQPYYVGLLSAGAIHGAAHQQPMWFQVITDRPTANIVFHSSSFLDSTLVECVQTETGYMRVSTPSATAFDLVRYAGHVGGLDNVATVLSELAERLDADELYRLAMQRPSPDAQRLGYLLDAVGQPRTADALTRALSSRRSRPVLLDPGSHRGEERAVSPWRVIPNVEVQADL